MKKGKTNKAKTKTNKSKKTKVNKTIKNRKFRKGGELSIVAPILLVSVASVSTLAPNKRVCYKNKTYTEDGFISTMNNSDAAKKCPPKVKFGRCTTCKKLARYIDEANDSKKLKQYQKKCEKCRGRRNTTCNFKEYMKYSEASRGACSSAKTGGDKQSDAEFHRRKKEKIRGMINQSKERGDYLNPYKGNVVANSGRIYAVVHEDYEVYASNNKKIGDFNDNGQIIDDAGNNITDTVDIQGFSRANDKFNSEMELAEYDMDAVDDDNMFGGKRK